MGRTGMFFELGDTIEREMNANHDNQIMLAIGAVIVLAVFIGLARVYIESVKNAGFLYATFAWAWELATIPVIFYGASNWGLWSLLTTLAWMLVGIRMIEKCLGLSEDKSRN